jgi:hypothetical protein
VQDADASGIDGVDVRDTSRLLGGYRRAATSPVQLTSRGSVHSVFPARGTTPPDTPTSRRPDADAVAEPIATTHDRASSVSFPHQHPATSINLRPVNRTDLAIRFPPSGTSRGDTRHGLRPTRESVCPGGSRTTGVTVATRADRGWSPTSDPTAGGWFAPQRAARPPPRQPPRGIAFSRRRAGQRTGRQLPPNRARATARRHRRDSSPIDRRHDRGHRRYPARRTFAFTAETANGTPLTCTSGFVQCQVGCTARSNPAGAAAFTDTSA